MIEAANALGLIEIEAQDADSRAYRLAQEGLEELKGQLLGAPIELLGEHRVRVRRSGESFVLESHSDGTVVRKFPDGRSETLMELGPGGGIHFLRDAQTGLDIRLEARTEDEGAYTVRLSIPPWNPRSEHPPAPPET